MSARVRSPTPCLRRHALGGWADTQRGRTRAQVPFRGVVHPGRRQGRAERGRSSRRDAIAALAQSVGGSLDSFHFAFGKHDAYVIVDLPDNEAATAVALTVNAAGGATVR